MVIRGCKIVIITRDRISKDMINLLNVVYLLFIDYITG